MCLACSVECHDGHQIEEIYTKRNFRCDCGTPRPIPLVTTEQKSTSTARSAGTPTQCRLCPEKESNEGRNMYSQNFFGRYCVCHRPYPDMSGALTDEEATMNQCVVCEDWFHDGCVRPPPPVDYSWEEMICTACAVKLPFLRPYSRSHNNDNNNVSVAPSSSGCTAPSVNERDSTSGRLYFETGWRERLCRCNACSQLREEKGVSFLSDVRDSISHFESEGKRALAESVKATQDAQLRALRDGLASAASSLVGALFSNDGTGAYAGSLLHLEHDAKLNVCSQFANLRSEIIGSAGQALRGARGGEGAAGCEASTRLRQGTKRQIEALLGESLKRAKSNPSSDSKNKP